MCIINNFYVTQEVFGSIQSIKTTLGLFSIPTKLASEARYWNEVLICCVKTLTLKALAKSAL